MEHTGFSGPATNERPERGRMIPAFDIFRIEPSGHVLWQGTQESFLKAKTYVHRIAMSSPGPYIIFNQITGEKVVLDQTDLRP
jgi:hypothetical protein